MPSCPSTASSHSRPTGRCADPRTPATHAVAAALVVALALTGSSHTAAAADTVLVSGRFNHAVTEHHGTTGAYLRTFAAGGGMVNAIGMDYGPDGHLYVASGDDPVVYRFDGRTGAFLDRFVWNDPATPGDETGGLAGPRGLLFGPDGTLYVSSGVGDQVLAYDGATGAFARVAAEGGGLDGPIGLVLDSDGMLLVAGGLTGFVHRFDPVTGASLGNFTTQPGLSNLTGLAWGPGGDLFVGSGTASRVYRFDGSTGSYEGVFASGSGLNVVIGVTWGPDGLLYVGSFSNDSVLRFDDQGAFVDTFVAPGAGGLNGTHFILFYPCIEDLDRDGSVGVADLLELLSHWGACACRADIDADGAVGVADLLRLLAAWGDCR